MNCRILLRGIIMIGILTYSEIHRKTYDVLCLLKAKGYHNVTVYAAPFHYKKQFQPLYPHRPEPMENTPDTGSVCTNFGYEYIESPIESLTIPKDEILLICGAGILPDDFVASHTIINAHPGYIPECRGLDAYKWAIYEGKPIGVTTHLLGEYIDAGEVIERRIIPVYFYDTFHSVAQRVYENEVFMLVEAIEKLDEEHMWIPPGNNPVHKRMPHAYETQLPERFDALVKSISSEASPLT